jgi:hypothetical protein
MRGRIGAHTLIWALPWDSVLRFVGLKPPQFLLGIHGGAHHVAPEAVSEMKTQAEAKLHMYYLI